MSLKKLGITFVLVFVLLSVSLVRADSTTVDDIAKELICQCGCFMVLNNCSHGECTVRDGMTALIKQKLAQGQSKEQILKSFVVQYGEQVLAEPPKRGFNLTAWLLPFAALLAGGGVICFALKEWVRRGRRSQTSAVAKKEDEEYRRRLEQELEEFEERGFR